MQVIFKELCFQLKEREKEKDLWHVYRRFIKNKLNIKQKKPKNLYTRVIHLLVLTNYVEFRIKTLISIQN